MSRVFHVKWESQGNIAKGTVIVHASSLIKAQDKFLDWIKTQALYSHMWRLSFEITEPEDMDSPVILE